MMDVDFWDEDSWPEVPMSALDYARAVGDRDREVGLSTIITNNLVDKSYPFLPRAITEIEYHRNPEPATGYIIDKVKSINPTPEEIIRRQRMIVSQEWINKILLIDPDLR